MRCFSEQLIVALACLCLTQTAYANTAKIKDTSELSLQGEAETVLTKNKDAADDDETKYLTSIEQSLKKVADVVKIEFDQMLTTLEVANFKSSVDVWYVQFSKIYNEFKNKSTITELVDDLSSSMTKLNIVHSVYETLRSMKSDERNINLLRSLKGDSSSVSPPSKWKSHINDIVAHIKRDRYFHPFLVELFKAFRTYDVQSDVSKYNVKDLNDWGTINKPQGIYIDQKNFQFFLNKTIEMNVTTANKVIGIVPNEVQLTKLNDVLDFTLKNRVIVECPETQNSKIVFKANFIKFSDFLSPNGTFKFCGWSSVSSLEIYALSKIFIDENLDATAVKLRLVIVAPKWEVIGNRKILLDGYSSKSLPKAANGASPGKSGVNGSPGLAGGSAGAFFGIGSIFINSKNLKISSNGGNGASGQSGGNGIDSNQGKSPPDVTSTCSKDPNFTYSQIEYHRKRWTDYYQYRFYAIKAVNGGNGGSCGAAGFGGFSGKISVLDLSKAFKINITTVNGLNGANGVPGTYGKGAVHGSDLITGCKYAWKSPGTYRWEKDYNVKAYYISLGRTVDGTVSQTCTTSSSQNPSPAASITDQTNIVQEFMNFVIGNSDDWLTRYYTEPFYQQMAIDQDMISILSTSGLIKHLNMLEKFKRESKKVDLVPFYQSHLKTIELYAANPRVNEQSDEFKKVLSYLYTATLTKIINLRNDDDSDQIIDINGYLDTVLHNIKSLSTSQDESRLVSVVETLKNDYKNELNKKIEEAQSLTENTVAPELAKIGSQFEVQMSGLIDETIALQNAVIVDKQALVTKKQELEKAMKFNIFLKVLKATRKVCSFFGTIGEIIGNAIDMGTSVTDSLRQGSSLDFPSGSKAVIDKLQSAGNAAIELSGAIKSSRSEIAEVTKGIKDLEKVLKELQDFETRIYEKLIPMIEKMGVDLVNTAKNLNSQSSVSLDVIGWQVQDTLKDTSLEIQQFTRGFEVQESVVRSVEKLEEVIKTLIKVHDRIQDYQEKQKLAVYMAQLSSASVKEIVVSNSAISESFRELQISIRSNVILNQYNSVLNAFKQWTFPFAGEFLKNFQLPEHLVSLNTDIEALASTASARIEDIKSRLQKYKTTIEDFDQHIYLAQFNGSLAIMKPFYVWKNEEHRDMITRLLAGDTVVVKADIENSSAQKDAIKFNYVEFGFKSDDPTIQAEIDRILLNYVVSMTHLGNSNYRYNGKYVSIVSSSQTMTYSVEKGAIQNNVYKKLLSGDIMLSPYAMWELHFKFNPFKSVKSFGSLESFADKVDLVLEGSGSFVNTGDTKFDVESYYKLDDSIKLTKT